MDQGPQYQNQQHGYDHYDQAPQAGARRRGLIEKMFGPKIAGQLKSPLVATCVLLLVGIGFAGLIMVSYPGSSDEEEAAVPIVQADARPFKTAPNEPGGMDIPFRDSTVFDTVRKDAAQDGKAPIENLLADDTAEEAVDKLAAFEEQVEDAVKEEAATESKKTESKKIVKTPTEELAAPAVAAAANERPKLHTPGASPDTIAFVRSVLDRKDGEEAGAVEEKAAQAIANATASQEAAKIPATQELSAIEPAAGAAGGAISSVAAPGDYFVQLASVTSQNATKTEWKKLQKKFSAALGGRDYTVQKASLGERGTYYRIRVGPYSKDYANSLCATIKAQKPGGCLVTK